MERDRSGALDTPSTIFDESHAWRRLTLRSVVGGVSAAVSKTAAAPIERVKLLIQNQVSNKLGKAQQHCGKSTSLQSIIVFLCDFATLRFLYCPSNSTCLTHTGRSNPARVANIEKISLYRIIRFVLRKRKLLTHADLFGIIG